MLKTINDLDGFEEICNEFVLVNTEAGCSESKTTIINGPQGPFGPSGGKGGSVGGGACWSYL